MCTFTFHFASPKYSPVFTLVCISLVKHEGMQISFADLKTSPVTTNRKQDQVTPLTSCSCSVRTSVQHHPRSRSCWVCWASLVKKILLAVTFRFAWKTTMMLNFAQLLLVVASLCLSQNAVLALDPDTDSNCPYWSEIGECEKASHLSLVVFHLVLVGGISMICASPMII